MDIVNLTALTLDVALLSKLNLVNSPLHATFSYELRVRSEEDGTLAQESLNLWCFYARHLSVLPEDGFFAFRAALGESHSKIAANLVDVFARVGCKSLRVIPAWIVHAHGRAYGLHYSRSTARAAATRLSGEEDSTVYKVEAVLLVAPLNYTGPTRELDFQARDLAPAPLVAPEFAFSSDSEPSGADDPVSSAERVSLPALFVKDMRHLARLAQRVKPKAADKLKARISQYLRAPAVAAALQQVDVE